MANPLAGDLSRRAFWGWLAGTAALFGLTPRPVAAEPPPETTTLRLDRRTSICSAPKYVAEELLRGEGFDNVSYMDLGGAVAAHKALAAGEIDLNVSFVGPSIIQIEAGDPIVFLAGAHVGCFELFGTDQVRAIRDLKGKTVAIPELGSPQHAFLSSMMAYVGLDPGKDVNWITHPRPESMQLLAEGKIDAYLGFPPDPQEVRTKQIGRVIINSSVDRPWSQYFCCMVTANREFVQAHPVATKRALRSILKAADICAIEPDRVARSLVENGFATRYDYALQALTDIPYNRWREYNPEDAVRFYALRLHEAGMLKSTPQKIIHQGTDWRFFNELKKELKG